MIIGKLNKLVTVSKRREAPDGAYMLTETMTNEIKAWANIEAVGNAIFWGSKQISEAVTHKITMRKQAGISEDELTGEYVINHNNNSYRVKRVSPEFNNPNYVKIEVEKLK